ncbi:baseplate J/gp47 family protein [Patescibacteria group bacterium]|nr:baseplate J/gp47 family protein [Patescibacteria group bacterium]
MNLPGAIDQLFHKDRKEAHGYLSLLLDPGFCAVAVWSVGSSGRPDIVTAAGERVAGDTWEERTEATDRALGKIDAAGGGRELKKVVLGLAAPYLTSEGDISSEIKPHIKKLTKTLDLEPIGYVSLEQSIIHKLKADEGVPPSVILLYLAGDTLTVSVYKVGMALGQRILQMDDGVAGRLEQTLKSYTEAEVLPSRIELFGQNKTRLEELQSQLLKHPWPTRANFLHFPKIEIIGMKDIITSVCFAGSAELAKAMGTETADESPAAGGTEGHGAVRAVAQHEAEAYAVSKDGEEQEPPDSETEACGHETRGPDGKAGGEASNVVMVEPESLGFRKKEDILDERARTGTVDLPPGEEAYADERIRPPGHQAGPPGLGVSRFASLLTSLRMPNLRTIFSDARLPGGVDRWKAGAGILILLTSAAAGLWFLPGASVTIVAATKTVSDSVPVTVDPSASSPSAASDTIPGKTEEATMSGEKTIAVTGTKQIGNPAKGTVTIYNKSLTEQVFPKGTVLTNGSLKFTLDSDVSVASASENIGSRIYGTGTADVTAVSIGPGGNLPSGTEFSFVSTPSSTVTARNDQALAGGSSKTVTVVSRADYDTLVKSVSDELVAKSTQELGGAVGSGDKLIEGTVQTTVSSKKFDQELDQQASSLHGTVTLTVSGTAYNSRDLLSLLRAIAADKIPAGYTVPEDHLTVALGTPKVQKDKTVNLPVTYTATAVPVLDTTAIRNAIAGKSNAAVQSYAGGITGVGEISVVFHLWPFSGFMPLNPNNISVTISENKQ